MMFIAKTEFGHFVVVVTVSLKRVMQGHFSVKCY